MTSPPPPSPTIPEDNNNEAILWATSDDSSSSSPDTDLLSLWLSNCTALPQFETHEEPLADVPTLLNFDLEPSFLDLVDWNTTSTTVTQAPVVTQPLWMQLHAPVAGEGDDLSQLTLGIQSPKASILPLAHKIQDREAFDSPLALAIKPAPASIKIVASQASLSPLTLGLQSPLVSFEIEPPQSPILLHALETESSILPLVRRTQFPEASTSPPISPLALGVQSPHSSFGIQSAPASILSLLPIPCTLAMAPPPLNLPSIPCTLPMAPPLWSVPSITSTLPIAPPLWNFLPNPSPVPERRSWSMFLSTPPAQQQLLLPHSASASVSSSSSYSSPQLHHFFPVAANTGYQQQVPAAHAHVPVVTSSTPNVDANFSAGFVPASRPLGSQAMAPRGSWTSNQPWISAGGVQDMKLPIPRRPRFLLPPPVPTMPASPTPSGNMSSSNMIGDVPAGDHQRVQTRPRKKSKVTVSSS